MGSYIYLGTALFGLIFVTSFYPALTSKSTTYSESPTLRLFDSPPALLSSHPSSSSSSSSPFPSSKASSPLLMSSNLRNFVIISTNRYGERDVRIALGHVRLHVLSIPSDKRYQLELRRTANRRYYINSVYKKGVLRDCEFTDNATEIAEFVSEFKITSYDESTTIYPILRHDRSNKKKSKKSKLRGWSANSRQDEYTHNKNRKKHNNNHKDNEKKLFSTEKSKLEKRGRYTMNAGYVLQIRYDRNISDSSSQGVKRKPFPYAVLFNANDIENTHNGGESLYLNTRINPKAETRVCRQLYRRVKRLSKLNQANSVRHHNTITYKTDTNKDNQGLPRSTDLRHSESKPPQYENLISNNSTKQIPKIKSIITRKGGTGPNPPFIHPHRHRHQHNNRHHISANSRTPGLTSPSPAVSPVDARYVKEHRANNGSNSGVRRRSRRQLNGMLIYPGTKWCGNGNTAEAFDDLGSETSADSCCREHDYCPFTIESFTRRFNLFNYRLHTLSHCECDYQFRKCLSKEPEESTVAHLIGRIYFDFLGSRCFVLTKEKYCVERSWWGKCRRYGIQLTAKIKIQQGY